MRLQLGAIELDVRNPPPAFEVLFGQREAEAPSRTSALYQRAGAAPDRSTRSKPFRETDDEAESSSVIGLGFLIFAERHRCMRSACMPSITIRNVPSETRDELAARAARSGRSLQEFLRARLIEEASRPDPAELYARIRARKERSKVEVSTARILEAKDADRR